MVKLALVMLQVVAVILMACISGVMSEDDPSAPPRPPQDQRFYKPRSKMTFYVQETFFTSNPTDLVVAGPGGDLSALQRGSVVVVTSTITKTADPSSATLGVYQGQYAQDGNTAIRVSATATLFPDSQRPYNTTYEIVGQRTSLTSTDDVPLAVVSGIQFNLEKKQYLYGLTGIAFIDTVSSEVEDSDQSSPAPSPSSSWGPGMVQNINRVSVLSCVRGRCQG